MLLPRLDMPQFRPKCLCSALLLQRTGFRTLRVIMDDARPHQESSTDMTGSRPKALVTAAVSGPGLDLLHELADLVLDSWLDQPSLRIYNAAQLAERAAAEGASIVIVESDVCGADLYEQPIIAVCSCRGDPTNVDVAAATAAGVPVLRAPGRNADAVAELAVALLFAATRGVVPADRDVREGEIYRDGKIPYQRYRAWELAGQTVGLVGLGAVGRALRWRLRGLGMDVLAYDPYAADATSSFDELLARSDVISVHAPVTEETTGMIDADAFAKMRDGVVYLNTARAKIHDTDALVAALASGKVGAAGLDHFEGEHLAHGPPADHVPPGGAHAAHRRRHLRHRVQPHPHHRRGPVPAHGRGAAAPHRQPRGPPLLTWRHANRPSSPPPSASRPRGPIRRTCDRARPTGWRPTWRGPATHPRICIIATAVGRRLVAAGRGAQRLLQDRLHQLAPDAVPDAERARRARAPAGPGRHLGGRRQHRQPAGPVAPARARRRPARVLGGRRRAARASPPARCAGTSAGRPTRSVPTLRPVTNGLAFLP